MTSARRRGLVLVVAALALAFAGSAEAKKKKKKPATHHKTPSGKSTGKPVEAAPDSDEKEEEEESKAPPAKAVPPAAEAAPEGETPSGGEGEGAKAAPKKKHTAVVPEAEAEAAPGTAPSALELVVGAGGLIRNLAWNQNMSPTAIVPYSLPIGPEAVIALETYPAAFFTPGFAGNIGLFGHFDYGFGVVSKTPAGASLTTKFQDFLVGLKLRIPVGAAVPYVSVAYGGQTFRLDGQSPTTVPGTNYTFIRGGLGARIHFGRLFDLDAGGGYLAVTALGTATGDIASAAFFPKAAGYAVEGGLSLGLRLTRLLGLRAGYDFRQYGLTLHQAQGVQPLVGGAADRYMTIWGGVELVFDGMGGGGSGSAGEEAAKPAPPPAAKPGKPRRQPEPDLSDDAGE